MLGTILAAVLILSPGQDIDDGFAEYLYSNGEFGLASEQYLRIIYSNGGDTLACPVPALHLARCWQELGRDEDAFQIYTYLYRNLVDSELRAGALMGAGSILEESGNFSGAEELYSTAAFVSEDEDLSARACIMAGLMKARSGNWEASAEELRILSSTVGPYADISGNLASLVAGGEDLSYRSPAVCGISSALIPGSGQMLCGHYTDGIIALGVNGALAWLFIESLHEENTTTSVLFGWLGLSFYGGNIYGGARAARTYNSARRRELIEEVAEVLQQHNLSQP